MQISLLQLNINADNYWDMLISFINSHDFDVLHLQEVAGKDTIIGNIHATRDIFDDLQKALAEKYKGELAIEQRFTSGPDSYTANATFYKKSFSLIEKKEVTLSAFDTFFPAESKAFERVGRVLLHLIFEVEGKQISFINTHLAWGRDNIEKPFQTQQGEILVDYLQTVKPPFILSGDFNVTPDQPLVKKIDALARNLISENKITNTLNPQNHRAKHLFPKGLAVDYIFASDELTITNFSVIDEGLSDHFGLQATIEL